MHSYIKSLVVFILIPFGIFKINPILMFGKTQLAAVAQDVAGSIPNLELSLSQILNLKLLPNPFSV